MRKILFVSVVTAVSVLSGKAMASEPKLVYGAPSCYDLGYPYEYVVEKPYSGYYELYPGGPKITIKMDGKYFDWSIDKQYGIDAVIVKGGYDANHYSYSPESYGDKGLYAPIDPKTYYPYDVSRVSFCYDYELKVKKDAYTSFKRLWYWMIDKSADYTNLVMMPYQVIKVDYTIKLDAKYVDSDFAVKGKISIYNPNPVKATIEAVYDVIYPDEIYAEVVCPYAMPGYGLAAYATATCEYYAKLPDSKPRVNKAIVTTKGAVAGAEGTADVVFSSDPTYETDECVYVTDSLNKDLYEEVCADDEYKTITYSLYVGPYDKCGKFEVKNVAYFKTNDTGTVGSDEQVVYVDVPCKNGCVRTQGYWKNHTKCDPKRADEVWEYLNQYDSACSYQAPAVKYGEKCYDGADLAFFCSGQTWKQVFETPPKGGNAYYILAKQYMAAVLNVHAGAATTPEVDSTLAYAEEFFEYAKPYDTLSKEKSAQLKKWADLLDKYNNGMLGVYHCSEEKTY